MGRVSSDAGGATMLFLLISLALMSEQVMQQGHAYKQVKRTNSCDFSQGKWVFDASYPLYDVSRCPFILKQFNCLGNGRPDKGYTKFRWQPFSCDLPKFDGRDFLSRMRGKSLMFVGDSLSLNQWQSLSCLIHTAVPEAKYNLTRVELLSNLSFPEYDVRLLYNRNAFLVDIVPTSTGRVLRLDSIQSGQMWKSADVLIFDTWHWWLHVGRKQPWDYIQEGKQTYKDMDRLVAYTKALITWGNWVDTDVDPRKTKIFFQGVSPDHTNASDWGQPPSTDGCLNQKVPFVGPKYPGGPHPAEQVVEKLIRVLKKPVHLLNVTYLSQLRIDGHPSVYGLGGHRGMDCTHWCLAGVPDTWNLLLYNGLIQG